MSTAYIFPGQGSQSVGMLSSVCQRFPDESERFFSNVSQSAGFDIFELINTGPESQLNQTEYTQVAMLASDVFIHQLAQQTQSISEPTVMAGHSLGEYAALVCAGAISIEDGVKIVRQRGRLMQGSVPLGEGAMAAIVGLDNEQVNAICQQISSASYQVMPANFNAPGQVVIAGHSKAVKQAIDEATAKSARLAMLIPVSVPCHCDLLKDAAHEFELYLQDFSFVSPKLPVIANVNAQPYQGADGIINSLVRQLYFPVLWVDSINYMVKHYDLSHTVEIGPGRVLSGLVKRINRDLKPSSAMALLTD